MRFGHTQVQGMIRGRDAGYNVINDITLSTVKYIVCSPFILG